MANVNIQKIQRHLRDFTQKRVGLPVDAKTHKHSLEGSYEIWRLARFLFSSVLSFEISDQPMEKINWWIDFTYKDKYRCSIAHQKFGFRIYATAETDELAQAVAEEIEAKLYKTINAALPLVEEQAKNAISSGEIIVENRFVELRGPYDYFRKKTAQTERASAAFSASKNNRLRYKLQTEKRYFEQATYFSFYSMIEHICVLFLAFRNVQERKDIKGFANLKWSEKFKIVFDVNIPEFKSAYDHMIGLARYHRNPNAHGYAYTAFSFYLEGARHKIPLTLFDHKIAIQWQNYEYNIDVLESFMHLIKDHPSTSAIFEYIESDLNVVFSKGAFLQNDSIAAMSKEEVVEYAQHMIGKYDDALNMDW